MTTRTIRRTTTTKEKKMITTTRTTTALGMAVLDVEVEGPDAPTYGGLRTPDMVERERLYWIGPDATVSCWMTADLVGLTDVLERAGWMARTGAEPRRSGLIVEPHNPIVPTGPLQRNGDLFTLWQYAADAMLTHQED